MIHTDTLNTFSVNTSHSNPFYKSTPLTSSSSYNHKQTFHTENSVPAYFLEYALVNDPQQVAAKGGFNQATQYSIALVNGMGAIYLKIPDYKIIVVLTFVQNVNDTSQFMYGCKLFVSD